MVGIFNPAGNLTAAAHEAALIRGNFSEFVGLASGANPYALPPSSKPTVWNFTTHGGFDPRDPGNSGVELGAGKILTVGEVYRSSKASVPQLVVLSACDTGKFDLIRHADDFVGLPMAFLDTGAADVVASLWKVDDYATALLMAKFYESLTARGERPSQALWSAQTWLRSATLPDLLSFIDARFDGSDPKDLEEAEKFKTELTSRLDPTALRPFADPHYWAAFELFGI